MCFKTRCEISKYEINIIPTYGMKVKIINRCSVFLTINKNEKEKACYESLGACILELQDRLGLTNAEVHNAVNIGHSTYNDVKKGWMAD